MVKPATGAGYSFPKGKIEKDEYLADTAWRELQEETGLTKEHVELIKCLDARTPTYIDEYHRNTAVINGARVVMVARYFIGKLIKPFDRFTFDRKELSNVRWVTVDKANNLHNFDYERKHTLRTANDIYHINQHI